MAINAKLVLLGDSSVGKTSVIKRFVNDHFEDYQESTIGAAFLTKMVSLPDSPKQVKFEIWDTAGQERYHSLAPMYYRQAAVGVIVFDITNTESFERAKKWVAELHEQASCSVIALTGNKEDLRAKRTVDSAEAREFAEREGLIFMETSAKTGNNVCELFFKIAQMVPDNVAPQTSQRLEDIPKSTSSQCCS